MKIACRPDAKTLIAEMFAQKVANLAVGINDQDIGDYR
jgi:hypothetical protein